LAGADLTFKWRPSEGGKYNSLLWASEYLSRTQSQPGINDEIGRGFASWLQFQFAERWAAIYRLDTIVVENTFDPVNLGDGTTHRNSAGVIYFPSEFSSFKAEFDQTRGAQPGPTGDTNENAFYLQANFTIGAHPAHAY
jgi:hypothetical protein